MALNKVVIGSDHGGFSLKGFLLKELAANGVEVVDAGPDKAESCDYPIYAKKVSDMVLDGGDGVLGILVCGTGLGMSIAANRLPGIRAAMCTSEYMARMARAHNDANILCMGERVMGPGLALSVVEVFLEAGFEGDRHARRIELIEELSKI